MVVKEIINLCKRSEHKSAESKLKSTFVDRGGKFWYSKETSEAQITKKKVIKFDAIKVQSQVYK